MNRLHAAAPPPLLLIVCGPAGTGPIVLRTCVRASQCDAGKSTFDREVVRRAAVGANGVQLVVNCAPTGIAACNLPGGGTLHSVFAINALTNKLTSAGPSVALAKARLGGARVIVLDEASMADEERLVQIERRLREWGDSNLPFGGYGMVLMGDWFQMRPVGGRVLTSAYYADSSSGGRLFRAFTVHPLVQQMRASNDPVWTAVLDFFTDPVKSMLPVRDSKLLEVVRDFSAADVAADALWHDAAIVTYDNATRHAINRAQAIRFARRHGVPVIAWPLRLDDKSAAAFEAAAQRHSVTVHEVREPYEAELTFYFVVGAPAYLTANICVDKGLVNSARVVLHSLTLNPSTSVDDEWARVHRARAGEVVTLTAPPLAVNVEVRTHTRARAHSFTRCGA